MSNIKPNTDSADIEAALFYISPDISRDYWVRVGMALKHELGDVGFDLFDKWSSNGQSYKPADAKSAWKSFDSNGANGGTVTIATLLKMAQEGGYQRKSNGQPYRQAPQLPQLADNGSEATERRQRDAKKWNRAQEFWNSTKPCKSHQYTTKKGVEPIGLRKKDGNLVAPLFDVNGKISSVQIISQDGKKRFLKGCKMAGCYSTIGKPKNTTIVVVEGWATGMSVHKATGQAVAVSFSSGNLPKIAKLMRQRYPDFKIILAPDNDE